MDDSTLLHGNAYESYGVLSPQRSVRSESPELIDFYPTHSSVGGVQSETSFDSRGLGSSFVVVTDESNVGVPRDLSSEYVRVDSVDDDDMKTKSQMFASGPPSATSFAGEDERGSSLRLLSGEKSISCSTALDVIDSSAEREVQLPHESVVSLSYSSSTSEINLSGVKSIKEPTTFDHDSEQFASQDVQQLSKASNWSLVSTSSATCILDQNMVTSAEPLLNQNVEAPLKLPVMSEEKKIQTTPDIRDWSTQTSPVRKSSKQDPTASASNLIFQEDTEFSPFVVDPPSDEVVDMSASTVLVERHISQKEGRILKSNNKEQRLKIKKLTEVLEQMRKELDKLRNEMESKSKDDDMKSAMILKEKELRRHIEELEDEHKLEVEKYKVELEECKVKLEKYKTELEKCEVELEEQRNRSQEAEERSQKKLVENEKVIVELQSAINTLQEQIMESKKELEKSEKMVKDLLSQLQASGTKNIITETEISVLKEKIDHLMKELADPKKSKHHHQEHHHHQLLDDKSQHNVHRVHEQSITRDPNRSEDVFSKPRKEPKPIEHDVHVAGSTSHGGDAGKASESSLNSYPKPKPRQYYEHHDPPHASHVHKSQPKPRPVQALVAPRLPFVGHNLLPLVNDGEHLQPYHHHLAVTKPPPAAQAKPTPPLNDAQKLAATANWVHKLPEHDERKQNSDKTVKEKQEDRGEYGVFNYPNRREKSDLSEERIDELSRSEGTVITCPICFQVLHSREKYGIELHVERCLQQSQAGLRN